MALAFLEFVLPSPRDVPAFRTAALLQLLEPFLAGGGQVDNLPPGVGGAALARIRQAMNLFDANKDGQLNEKERESPLEFVRRLAPRN